MANDEPNLNDRNDKCTTFDFAIPSEVENRAAGEAATWTGRPKAKRTGERIKSLINHHEISRLCSTWRLINAICQHEIIDRPCSCVIQRSGFCHRGRKGGKHFHEHIKRSCRYQNERG